MQSYRHFEKSGFNVGGLEVAVVRFVDRKIDDDGLIMELGEELYGLVEKEKISNLVLNFYNVTSLSSKAMNKFIILDKKIKAHRGVLRFCNVAPHIYAVFEITRLNQLFDVRGTEGQALLNWRAPAAV